MAVPCTTEKLIVGTYKMILNGYDLGATTGGVSITQNNEFTEVRNDQIQAIQGIFRTQQDITITTNMLEPSLDKLRFLYGVKEGFNGTDVLCVSADAGCSFPEEFTLSIETPGPGCMCRVFHFPRIVVVPSSVEYNVTREAPVEVTAEFRVLPSCPEGLLMCVSDACDVFYSDLTTEAELTISDDPVPNYSTPATPTTLP